MEHVIAQVIRHLPLTAGSWVWYQMIEWEICCWWCGTRAGLFHSFFVFPH